MDGAEGEGSLPFMSAPDQFGKRHAFAITWAATPDVHGSVVIRAQGAGAERIRGTMDNTDIYRVMYKSLFGDLKE
jgi:alkaline phosphatase